jgi:hypothetical protein
MSQGPSVLDESRFFSREEYVNAHALIMSRRDAEQFVEEFFFHPPPAEAAGRYTYLGDDTMNLLSLLSESCAERVRQFRNETPQQANERIQEFAKRTGLRLTW